MSPHRVKDYVFYSEEWLEVRYEHYNISYFKPDLTLRSHLASSDVGWWTNSASAQPVTPILAKTDYWHWYKDSHYPYIATDNYKGKVHKKKLQRIQIEWEIQTVFIETF